MKSSNKSSKVSNKNTLPWGMILASGAKAFVASVLFFMVVGSAHWAMFGRKEKSYVDAFKRAYSVSRADNADVSDAMGLMTVVLSLMIGAWGALQKKDFAREISRGLDNSGPKLLHNTYGRDLDLSDWVDGGGISYVALCQPVSKIARCIIKQRASKDSNYFEDVLKNYDNISQEIFYDVVLSHLKNHPEDYEKILASGNIDIATKKYLGQMCMSQNQMQRQLKTNQK